MEFSDKIVRVRNVADGAVQHIKLKAEKPSKTISKNCEFGIERLSDGNSWKIVTGRNSVLVNPPANYIGSNS